MVENLKSGGILTLTRGDLEYVVETSIAKMVPTLWTQCTAEIQAASILTEVCVPRCLYHERQRASIVCNFEWPKQVFVERRRRASCFYVTFRGRDKCRGLVKLARILSQAVQKNDSRTQTSFLKTNIQEMV